MHPKPYSLYFRGIINLNPGFLEGFLRVPLFRGTRDFMIKVPPNIAQDNHVETAILSV